MPNIFYKHDDLYEQLDRLNECNHIYDNYLAAGDKVVLTPKGKPYISATVYINHSGGDNYHFFAIIRGIIRDIAYNGNKCTVVKNSSSVTISTSYTFYIIEIRGFFDYNVSVTI